MTTTAHHFDWDAIKLRLRGRNGDRWRLDSRRRTAGRHLPATDAGLRKSSGLGALPISARRILVARYRSGALRFRSGDGDDRVFDAEGHSRSGRAAELLGLINVGGEIQSVFDARTPAGTSGDNGLRRRPRPIAASRARSDRPARRPRRSHRGHRFRNIADVRTEQSGRSSAIYRRNRAGSVDCPSRATAAVASCFHSGNYRTTRGLNMTIGKKIAVGFWIALGVLIAIGA